MSAAIDDVLVRFSKEKIKLLVQDSEKYLIIRGSRRELEFLASLILAHAYSKDDKHIAAVLHPNHEGQRIFDDNSNKGICVYRDDNK